MHDGSTPGRALALDKQTSNLFIWSWHGKARSGYDNYINIINCILSFKTVIFEWWDILSRIAFFTYDEPVWFGPNVIKLISVFSGSLP